MSCWALQRAYRDVLREGATGALFVHVAGDRALIHGRLARRSGHFAPPALLDSQLGDAGAGGARRGGGGLTLDPALAVDTLVETVARALLVLPLEAPA